MSTAATTAHDPNPDGAASETPEAVEAHRLLKRYDAFTAVNKIDFTVRRGESFGLLGPNGAGKSTTMRMIYCRTPPSDGRLLVEGWDVRHHSREIKSLVGVVPQENNLDPDLDVLDNLRLYARYFRIDGDSARRQAEELLDFMGLTEKRRVSVEALSGGMKRRLIVARALVNDPRLLILDEPTTGLDPHARHDLWDRLRELRRRRITIVLSTHYMEEAEQLCDRLIIMDRGKILTAGRPKDLIEKNALKFVLVIHEVDGRRLPSTHPAVLAESHGSTHYYFAPDPELLAPLIKLYEGYETLLRPSNLEDVFLRLTGRGRSE